MDPEEIKQRRAQVLLPSHAQGAVGHFEDDHCANCGDALIHWLPRLFCDDWCRETAGAVRYARGTTRDGRTEDDPKVFDSIQIKFAHLLNGGYQSLGRDVTQTVRKAVIARDGGVCVRCGEPANQVDHMDGSDNSAGNLQLLCDDCHRAKTYGSLRPAPEEESLLLRMVWLVRISPEQPALRCDDEREWQTIERQLRRERDIRLDTEVATLGIKARRRMTKPARAVLLAEAAQDRAAHPPLPDAREGLLGDDGWLML